MAALIQGCNNSLGILHIWSTQILMNTLPENMSYHVYSQY